MITTPKIVQVKKGLLEFVVLKVIARSRVYAAEIIETLSETEFATQEGTLYPLLSRMRRDGLLDYEWQESESGPPRKYYVITQSGVAHLNEITAYWNKLNKTIDALGEPT